MDRGVNESLHDRYRPLTAFPSLLASLIMTYLTYAARHSEALISFRHFGQFRHSRETALRGQLVHHARQYLQQLLGDFFFGETRPLSECLMISGPSRRAELARRYSLILAGADLAALPSPPFCSLSSSPPNPPSRPPAPSSELGCGERNKRKHQRLSDVAPWN
jgi:hypothetical protein